MHLLSTDYRVTSGNAARKKNPVKTWTFWKHPYIRQYKCYHILSTGLQFYRYRRGQKSGSPALYTSILQPI